MHAIGKELEANRAILDLGSALGIQDEEQWAQNVESTCEGFQTRDQCLRLLQSLFS